MDVPPVSLLVPILINYLAVWVSYTLSRRSIRSNGKKNVGTLLGVLFIFSCMVILAGLAIRDPGITSLEIKLFGGKPTTWDYKYGKAVIREGHEMYAENATFVVHILINLVYLALLCWPTHKLSRIWNSTALTEEKIEELKQE